MDTLAVAQILNIAVRIFTIICLCLKLDKIHDNPNSYKYNHRMECIREANARHKVIIFCKSHPLNWQLGDLYPIHLVGYFY